MSLASKLLILEGISGSGKDTRAESLLDHIGTRTAYTSYQFTEPAHLREEIEAYRGRKNRDPLEEMRLFARDRRLGLQDYAPLLREEGNAVLLIRSFISSLVYQSLQGVPMETILEENSFFPQPDLALILLCDPKIALERIQKRAEETGQRISPDEVLGKIRKLRDGYEAVARRLPYAHVVDTNGRGEAIDLVVRSHANHHLGVPMKKAVFLDKDGTLVDNSGYPEVIPSDDIYPETFGALRAMQDKGYLLFVVSSQPWVARGRMTETEVEAVFTSLAQRYKEEGIIINGHGYCVHQRSDNCPDKKPNTRLLERFVEEHDIDTTASFMIGDSDIDTQTGRNLGLQTVLVETGSISERGVLTTPDHKVKNLAAAEKVIC